MLLGAAAPLTPLLPVTSLSFLLLIWYTKQDAQFRKCGKPATRVSTWKLGLQVTTEMA